MRAAPIRSCRRFAVLLAAAAGLGAAPDVRAQDVAWAYVDPAGQPLAFTPDAAYQYTPSGAAITVSRDVTLMNRWHVRFPDMAPNDGCVHLTPYGGSHIAVVAAGGTSGTNVLISVDVFLPTGVATTGAFTIHYRRGGDDARREAYLWASSPTAASYTPNPLWTWNGSRGAPTITRTAVGVYQVRLPGLATTGAAERGHVQVTASGSGARRAKVENWAAAGSDLLVQVRCFGTVTNPADVAFFLSYHESAAPIDAMLGSGAHVWANLGASTLLVPYAPDPYYRDSNGTLGPGDAEVVMRYQTGRYRVELPSVAPSQHSIAVATAYGSTPYHAAIAGWQSNGCGGTYVYVDTFGPTGLPANSQFTLLYLTDRPAATQAVAWAWVQPAGQGASFAPAVSYQHTSSGGNVLVLRDAAQPNRFQVQFPGLAPSTGVVHASAYGGNHLAVVNSWGVSSGNTVAAWVELFTPSGAPANDGAFTIHYRRGGNRDDREACLWANDPTSPSYTPSTTYSWNGNRPDPTIQRIGVGAYEVTLPGLGVSASGERGHVQVTPYATVLRRAKVAQWGAFGSDLVVSVRCFDAAGVPADSQFVLGYHESAAPIGPAEGSGAHVWANQPTATVAYAPPADYTDSNGTFGPIGAERVTRLSTGSYRVDLPDVAPSGSSVAMVTAYGTTAHAASVASWQPNGAGGTRVQVRTYAASGALADAPFLLSYLTNRSSLDDPGARNRAFGTGCHGVALVAELDPLSTPTAGTSLPWTVLGAPPFAGGSGPVLGLLVLSLGSHPGLPLAALGAPGCYAYVASLDATLLFTGPGTGPLGVTFPLPPGIPCGTLLFAQAAVLTDQNAFGIVTSNAVESRISDF